MKEPSLEAVVPEREFAALLEGYCQDFAAITSLVLASSEGRWPKRYYFRLQAEADELEALLDDYGARHNRTYCVFTELTASVRSFALAGLSLTHLAKRLGSYAVLDGMQPIEAQAGARSIERARSFVQECVRRFCNAWWKEAENLDFGLRRSDIPVQLPAESVRFRLPRNVDQQELEDEEQRIAEVASKYLQASEMLADCALRSEPDGALRDQMLAVHCDEQMARVFEATVHNLQSAYDTFVGNTRLEASDSRLRRLRGHISGALHMLEAVTHLTHFVERHDNDQRSDLAMAHLARVVERHEVQEVLLNDLFLWARKVLAAGEALAQELLPRYTDLQTIELELPEGVSLHARPASLLVGIANYHGTPVEMVIGEKVANLASILEVMVLVGSHADNRHFRFRGDAKPLADIRKLFEFGLGERGLDGLPADLNYLRR
ncbi:MAG: hypothetical protein R3F17_04600 [Planctomycetota bacterium]